MSLIPSSTSLTAQSGAERRREACRGAQAVLVCVGLFAVSVALVSSCSAARISLMCHPDTVGFALFKSKRLHTVIHNLVYHKEN